MKNNKVYLNRSEIFELIGGRVRHKFSNSGFNDYEYTKEVVTAIQSASNEDILYNENGYTLLHLAVQEGELEFVKALVKRGLSVNSGDDNECYPLDLAISYSNTKEQMIDIISILLQAGADLDKKSKNYTPREMIKMFNDERLYCFLSKEEQEELINKQEDIPVLENNNVVKSEFNEEDYYDFVTTNNFVLDKIYLEFLKKYNGCTSSTKIKCANGFNPYITLVFSFDEVKRAFVKTRLDKKLKDGYLPIACINDGNDYVFIKVKGKDKGKISIYLPNVRYVVLVADNLLDFFSLLNIDI